MLSLMLQSNDDNGSVEITLEHSLVSLSKWESIHEKPFFSKDPMNAEETISYINQMIRGEIPPGDWHKQLKPEHFQQVTEYINSKQTATWFREDTSQAKSSEIVTNELIYYWMIGFQIPFKPCEDWHLNRLMTLIKIAGVKQSKPKKMSRQQQAEEYRRLNAERRAQLGTSG